ncbi:multidrug resistance-associated protein 1 isoform X2 [Frankliniella occidentalis]|uniref:ABC-type glutathione-S-conjugate transporter n=1 Tax=Frankliniella occidentalis TaxID=133901 RepID=A0A6J1SPJ1_FRAOC|nr:multidrug resistance-associated protein 1 isoform X2 [Frankliniella occidentalis]
MAYEGMDAFCGSPFWNSSRTWETDDPDFTICFEKTALVWAPCVFLWCFAPLEAYYIAKSRNRDIPWNWLNISKLIFTGLLVALSVADMGNAAYRNGDGLQVYSVDYYTPLIKIATFFLAGVLLAYNRKHGICSSGLLTLFWLFLFLFGIPQYRTELREELELRDASEQKQFPFISSMIYLPLVLGILVLNCFADAEPRHLQYRKTENMCPELNASFFSKVFFLWFDPFAWKGFRNPLETKDLWAMKPEDAAEEVVPLFTKFWEETVQKTTGTQPGAAKASFRKSSGSVDLTGGPKKPLKQASVLPALCKAFGPTFVFGAVLKLIVDLLTFVSPQILKLLISFVAHDEPLWKGLLYAIVLLLTAMIQTLFLAQYFHRMFLVGMRIRTALVAAIYRKALRMSNSARKESTVGEIVNLMSVDAQRFIDLTAYLNMIWSAPLQIALALYFLWNTLGPSVLAGLAVMIILIPVNGVIASKVKNLQITQMKYKDERVKLMNEILSGMKVLKLYAWEPSFEDKILKIRDKEIKVLKQAAYLNAGTAFIWACAPFLVSLVSFATFVLVDEKNVLDSEKAFVSLSLFNILRFPLSMLPMMISNLVQAAVSIKRINKYMNSEDLDPSNVSHDTKEGAPLNIESGTFAWGPDEPPTLKNINFKVNEGSLVAVVGSVGSGKSSLLSALLGEMDKISGQVNAKGSLAYVPQQAWIQNATLKNNILFGKSADNSRYVKVVDACALKSDFDMLPGGDQTEIGEKGINLSGGQKQRVSLARAVYNDAEVYLLDDPLSAVDSHVGKHIFDNVIGPQGLLKKKTRVLVTHGITFLREVDLIVVLKDGEVSETGTFKELMEKKGAFAEFLLHHLQEVSNEGDADAEEMIAQLEGTLGAEELQKELHRRKARVSESQSDTGSIAERTSLTGSLKRGGSGSSEGLRRRHSSEQKEPTPPKQDLAKGEKLIEAEKAETGSVKWRVYAHYLSSIGVFLSVATIVLNMIFQGFSIGSNVWLSKWSAQNYTNLNGSDYTSTRDMYLGVYGALGFGQVISVCFSSISLSIGALNAATILHHHLLQSIIRLPMMFFDVTPIGRILSRFSTDVNTLDLTMPGIITMFLSGFFRVIATLVVISYSTPLFIAVILPVGILYYFVQRFYVATSRQLKRLESVSRSPIYSHFGESITGASSIRAYGVVDRFVNESEEKVDFNQVCFFPSIIANRWLAVRLEMVGNFIIFFAALFAVISKDSSPDMAGLVGLSISYALQITQTLNWLVRMTSDVETNIVAVERIKEYGETPQEAAWENPNSVVDSNWPQEGKVDFKDYEVRYREGLDLVLKGINFTVKGGEKVGIVGRTGAGKSSLTLALFRIIEAAGGQILIDGVDISKLGLHALRSRLTIIPQDPVLFSGSMRLNLDPFGSFKDDDIWRALEHAHLKSFVKGLAAGLEHEVTEGGENLSVGQRQLICLARALLRKTKVLVLDEATAAVDLETDDLIQRTIREEFKECTILTIAHRLNTIMDSDRVLVLDQGKVVEYESPDALLHKKTSIFYSMAKDAGLV